MQHPSKGCRCSSPLPRCPRVGLALWHCWTPPLLVPHLLNLGSGAEVRADRKRSLRRHNRPGHHPQLVVLTSSTANASSTSGCLPELLTPYMDLWLRPPGCLQIPKPSVQRIGPFTGPTRCEKPKKPVPASRGATPLASAETSPEAEGPIAPSLADKPGRGRGPGRRTRGSHSPGAELMQSCALSYSGDAAAAGVPCSGIGGGAWSGISTGDHAFAGLQTRGAAAVSCDIQ